MTEASTRAARPLRILEVETFGRGGLIHYAYNLSCALAERGHEVTLVTAAAYELADRELPARLRVVPIIARGRYPAWRWLPSAVRGLMRKAEALRDAAVVAALARRLHPDVVHLHSTNQIGLAYLILLRLLKQPVVVTAHVVTPHERTTVQDAIHRAIHRLSPMIVAHSEFDRRRLLDEVSVDATRVAVIPHGEYGFFKRSEQTADRAAARAALGLRPDDEVALFFGYIREYKGLDVLLSAWPAVRAARPHARLLIAGDPVRLPPARRAVLETTARDVGAITRFGYVPFGEVTRYLAAANTLVLPYRHISQSGVLFLALALGLPIVATRVGAMAEVVQNDVSALLVAPGSPDELATAIVRMLGDAELRARLAAEGRRVAERFSWPSIAGQTERAFEGLLARQPQRGA